MPEQGRLAAAQETAEQKNGDAIDFGHGLQLSVSRRLWLYDPQRFRGFDMEVALGEGDLDPVLMELVPDD